MACMEKGKKLSKWVYTPPALKRDEVDIQVGLLSMRTPTPWCGRCNTPMPRWGCCCPHATTCTWSGPHLLIRRFMPLTSTSCRRLLTATAAY